MSKNWRNSFIREAPVDGTFLCRLLTATTTEARIDAFESLDSAPSVATIIEAAQKLGMITRFAAAALGEPRIDVAVDSDGDNHFTARIQLPDGKDFVLRQSVVVGGGKASDGAYKERCRLACERFSEGVAWAAAGRRVGPTPALDP